MTKKKPSALLVIGDVHAPYFDRQLLKKIHKLYILLLKDHLSVRVIQVGDLVDQTAWSRFPRDPDAPGATDEWERTMESLLFISKLFPEMEIILGNHDCLDNSTEVLTKEGWKHQHDIKETDTVYGLLSDGVTVVEQLIHNIIRKQYTGKMFSYQMMRVTAGHRIPVKLKKDETIQYQTAESLLSSSTRRVTIPLAGHVFREDASLSDEEIRIGGWLLTDCGIAKNDYITFYQSGEKSDRIRTLLNTLGITYKESCRNRDTKQICGKELKKKCKPSYEFHLSAESSRDLLERLLPRKDKNVLPEWVRTLSSRQWEVFQEELIFTDGSRHKVNNAAVFYCDRVIGDELQAEAVLHGFCWNKSSYTNWQGTHIRYNISRQSWGRGADGPVNQFTTIEDVSNEEVWCLSVPTTNFLVRRNGIPFFTGNCRIMKNAMSVGIPTRLLRTIQEEIPVPGWAFHKDVPLYIGDVAVIHGDEFPTGTGNTALAASRLQSNLVYGHSHQGRIQYANTLHKHVWQMNVGCVIDESAIAFRYAAKNPMRCFKGVGVVEITAEGNSYPILIPANNL